MNRLKLLKKSVLNREVVAGLTRHVMSGVGTTLAANGYISESEAQLLTGAAVTVASVVWSWWQKRATPKRGI